MKTIRMIIILMLSVVLVSSASAFDMKFQWAQNTESDLAGYKVYYGVNDLSNPTSVDVSSNVPGGAIPTNATISGLDPDLNYSFTVVAYNSSGLESSYSNVITSFESVLPTVSISSPVNNANVSNTVEVRATASDNVGVVNVEYYVNGTLKSTVSTEPYLYYWDTQAVTPGTYSISAKAYDAAGNVGVSTVSVNLVNDLIPPTISYTAPLQGNTVSGTVAVSCNASDDVGVTRVEFYVNGAMDAAVNTTPYNYMWDTKTVSNGSYVLTAKAYDAAGNVSVSSSRTVTVNNPVPDIAAPLVNAFTLPATSTTLTVAVSTFTASDNVGVTGYLITSTSTKPLASATGWTVSAPTTVSYTTAGSKTAYAWAKDAAGNVSLSRSAIVSITLPDTTAPVVSVFTMPTASSTLTIAVTALSATDAVGVTGYLITSTSTKPLASATGWTVSIPTSFTFSTAGSNTAYAWAKDTAGNVSLSRSATVTITLPDTTAPVVSAFTMPVISTTLTAAVTALTATDAVGVTGYLITSTSTKPLASDTGWTSSAPASVTYTTAGSKTAYAWAKDAAGNVSLSRTATVTITLPDTTAPVVSAFTMPVISTTLTVAVTALTATDAVGVTGYLITGTSTKPLASDTGWTSSAPASVTYTTAGSKTAYAWARDAAGNVSLSRTATVTIAQTDTTAPVVSIRVRKDYTDTSGKLTITATASDNVGVNRVEFFVNGVYVATDTSAPYVFYWDSNAVPDGYYTLKVKAYDAAGNIGQSASVKISVPYVRFR